MAGRAHARFENSTARCLQAIGSDGESFSRGTLAAPFLPARGSVRARSALLIFSAKQIEISAA